MVTQARRQKIEAVAGKEGIGVSEYVRRLVDTDLARRARRAKKGGGHGFD